MPNPIIQNYLNDEAVPMEKRKKLFDALEGGAESGNFLNENEIASEITKRFGDKYNPKSRIVNGQELSVKEWDAQQNQEKQMGFGARIKNAFIKTGQAIKEGAGQAQEGGELIRASETDRGIAETYMKKTQKEFDEGKIDKMTYERKMAKANDIMAKASGQANLGFSKQVAGATRAVFSPYEGALMGGFEPEMNKVMNFASEKIGDSQAASDFVSKLDQLAKEHPAMANYLTAGFEVAGVRGGNKILKKAGEGAMKGAKMAAPIAKQGLSKGADLMEASIPKIAAGVDRGINLIDDTTAMAGKAMKGKRLGKNLAKAEELLTPELTSKNLRIASSQGLATEGKKSLFGGAKDVIALDKRMKNVARTLSNKFPDLNKASSFDLPSRIDGEISKIAKPLRDSFQKIEVPDKVKSSLKESWENLKKEQMDGLNFELGVDKVQKKFETIFNKVISVGEGSQPQNINDLWDAVKAFDKQVGTKVQDALEKTSDARSLAQQEAWLESRRLLREAMDSVVESAGDVNTKRAFREMADLYEAQSRILENIKPTNKSGSSIAKDLAKGYGKQTVAALAGGTAAGVVLR